MTYRLWLILTPLLLMFARDHAEATENPELKVDRNPILLDPDPTAAVEKLSVTCRASLPVGGSTGSLALYRKSLYGQEDTGENSLALGLAHIGSLDDWKKVTKAKSSHQVKVLLISDVGALGFTYTIQEVTCYDAGTYLCVLNITNNSIPLVEADTKNVTVIVKPGPIYSGGQETHVVVTEPDVNVTLNCTGTVGTFGAGEELAWVWEYRESTAPYRWATVENSTRFFITVSALVNTTACTCNQSTTLTFLPLEGEGNVSYRCYPRQNGYHLDHTTVVFRVDRVIVNDTTPHPHDRVPDARQKSAKYLVWILIACVLGLLIIVLFAVCCVARRLKPRLDTDGPTGPGDTLQQAVDGGDPGLVLLTDSGPSLDTTGLSASRSGKQIHSNISFTASSGCSSSMTSDSGHSQLGPDSLNQGGGSGGAAPSAPTVLSLDQLSALRSGLLPSPFPYPPSSPVSQCEDYCPKRYGDYTAPTRPHKEYGTPVDSSEDFENSFSAIDAEDEGESDYDDTARD